MTVTKFRTLVSTNWLRDQLFTAGGTSKTSPLRVLDASSVHDRKVDGYTEFYKKSHIPTASYFNLHKLCPASPSSLHKYPVPDANRFQDYTESLGICNNTHIVTYDRTNTMFAFKTWWLFRLFGHTKVSVLDGGFKKWLNDTFEVTAEEPIVQRSRFQPAYNPKLLYDFEDMVHNLKTQDRQMIDTRTRAAFNNDTENMPDAIGGHLPGSTNIPYTELFEEDGTLKSLEDIKGLLDKAGVDLSRPTLVTCQRGMTACGLAASLFMMGKEDVPVYNGSFREWGKRAEPDHIVN